MKTSDAFMKQTHTIASILLAVLVFLFAVHTWASIATIAVVSKVVADVTKKIGSSDWSKAQKGDPLASGDFMRTGDKSIAVVKFKDNSIIRIRENSELKIQGEVRGDAFSKSVDLNRGVIGFEIQKQENEQFTFTSPTSVASIRGTRGLLESSSITDVLVVLDGLVNLRNLLSNTEMDVGAGQTGMSRPNGTVEVRNSTQQERDRAAMALRAGDEGMQKELKIEMRDPQGNKKDLKIRYRE
jgi:ferric-dicitrate binding protein FerR (iron transport regulator)